MARSCSLILVLAAVVMWTTPASAVLVTAGGQTLFSDNFENPSLPSPPDSDPDNLTLPGSWIDVTEVWETAIQVLDQTTVSPYVPTAAFEGDNYLKFYRPNSNCWASASLEQGTGLNDVTATWMTFIPGTQPGSPTALAVFALTDQAANGWQGRTWVAAWADGRIQYYDGAWKETGLNWTPGEWQEWEMHYTPDTDGAAPYNGTYTISVDGVSSAPLAQLNTAGYAVTRFTMSAGSDGGVFCVDAVPEPATLVLLLAGGLLLRRRSM
ncbi:MAG: PEP-CTERM sorting domain-containing protein [Phycisphaerae bacterium]|nr:PEP-CTERM sorting domain-containing protein [Phycisphaerae bacterium]